MMPMETATTHPASTKAAVNSTVMTAAEYGKLPPLNPDDLKPPPPPPSAAAKATTANDSMSLGEVWDEIKGKLSEAVMGSSVSGILSVIRIVNLVLAALMITICVLEMINSPNFSSAVSNIMAVVYTIMFALILVAYETRTQSFDDFLRANYGFMYNPWGRCLFLAMISIFPFGMFSPYGWMLSIAGFINAYFNYFVITKHPSFTRGVPDYVPPSVDTTV
ncbi:transmembrane protein [Achlya hypogyna]|uniref:Transmembrane protein n=1 Tax=Achlya hypogyna TaxID=1202772 RepID=A0A1V9YX72_ACHHY|nr:transmembrane protein [Achlya hypogyna]